jgi:hypothetical protein
MWDVLLCLLVIRYLGLEYCHYKQGQIIGILRDQMKTQERIKELVINDMKNYIKGLEKSNDTK